MYSDILNEFQGRFDDLRHEKGLTQAAIAESLEMTPQQFSKIIRAGNPKFKVMRKIAEVMGVHPSDFFCS